LIVNSPRQRGARPLFRLFCHNWQEASDDEEQLTAFVELKPVIRASEHD
jgi:hypothetical protein